jgi:hypothetical protein
MRAFLEKADFYDGLIIPFWTQELPSQETDRQVIRELEDIVAHPRILPQIPGEIYSGAFPAAKTKMRNLSQWVNAWLANAERRVGMLERAGEYPRDVMRAFAAVYPQRISGPVALRKKPDGSADWAFMMDGEYYFYDSGRFLSEADLRGGQKYNGVLVYNYTPDFEIEPSETAAESSADRQGCSPPESRWRNSARDLFYRRDIFPTRGFSWRAYSRGNPRSPFYERLLRAENREQSFESSALIQFLGWRVRVHSLLVEPLARVEARILALQEANGGEGKEIVQWRRKLDSITAWNRRNVAGSNNRSYHAYGTAVDLLMKSERGKETYWQWTRDKGIDPASVRDEDKQNPPDCVINIFEEEGFIWGGKWRSWFDTMHFEYRPESILLSFR